MQAAYLNLPPGELAQRAERLKAMLEPCTLCPRGCKANRLSGKPGLCKTGAHAWVAGFEAHHGEEACISGWKGSGVVFFSRCSLHCVYCQNAELSQAFDGKELDAPALAALFLRLQAEGCHNLNLVTPGHVAAQIVEALVLAVPQGLTLPLVYNTSGYDSLETLALLDGIVDIYMPDLKYTDSKSAHIYSGVKNYPTVNRAALKEMQRQVGDLQVDEDGLARRGLLVRHLVLPNRIAGSIAAARFLAEEISPRVHVNVMDQYWPAHLAQQFPPLNRKVTGKEMAEAREAFRNAGLIQMN
ncbi:MAG: radical SAM protein [Anaerolineae bacterium]|nr:radical SAM protein [Anaerolineae bacterium]